MLKICTSVIVSALFAISATSAIASEKNDEAMKKIASTAGCFTCHSIEHKDATEGMKPIGPAWKDVAVRYKDDKKAEKKLVGLVLEGSSPYGRHWKEQTSGVAMPPNAVAISEADTKKLVKWILALK